MYDGRPNPTSSNTGNVARWDITYLRAARRGSFYYLYLLLDVWSRKIVGWSVHEVECADLASALVTEACAAEGVNPRRLACTPTTAAR